MELKTKYQYTYFVYPYVVKESKYEKYLYKLLKDKKCKLRIFEKERDLDIYSYFLPRVRKFLFPTFEFNKFKCRKLEEMDAKMKAALLATYPCMIFEYELGDTVQGKTGDGSGIFFDISKIEIVCFKTGICYLLMKTHINESNQFEDVLNFNYKFREICSEAAYLKEFENIKIQTDAFENMKKLTDVIEEITGSNVRTQDCNIETEKFMTYSYTCLEQESWNETKKFEEIEHEFSKYYRVLPSNDHTIFKEREDQSETVLSNWEFVRCGFSKLGASLLTSSMDTNNYTKLPFAYENQYLYTFLLFLYQKMYMKKLNRKTRNTKQIKRLRRGFTNFVQNVWVQDVTNDDTGSKLCQKWKEVLELNRIYQDETSKLDVLYKEMKIEKMEKVNKVVMAVLAFSLLLNVITYILLFRFLG